MPAMYRGRRAAKAQESKDKKESNPTPQKAQEANKPKEEKPPSMVRKGK